MAKGQLDELIIIQSTHFATLFSSSFVQRLLHCNTPFVFFGFKTFFEGSPVFWT